jgi:UV radiation resistance-associated gene protein
MSDRNLRALDMRHTLPNLKNLLLTLSDEEEEDLSLVSSAETPTN